MARTDTVTLLSPDRYAQIMQIDPYHFNQIGPPLAPLSGGCDDIWDQEARDNLVDMGIKPAEDLIADALGFYPSPKFITDENIRLLEQRGHGQIGGLSVHKTRWRYVEGYGVCTLREIQLNAPVTYTNHNNNPFDRSSQAQIGGALYDYLTPCADCCTARVFFRVADGADDPHDSRWEIRPLRVDHDGTEMWITGHPSQFVRPEYWELNEWECQGSDDETAWIIPWSDDSIFVSAVDVYCEVIDTSRQATFYWSQCTCSNPCNVDSKDGCIRSLDDRFGHFEMLPNSACSGSNICMPTYPDTAKINYKAGYPLDRNCSMDKRLERAIVKLTNALLPEPPCGFCDPADTIWKRDREQVSPLTMEAANLPWDLYTKGALEAWRIVKRMAL